MWEVTCPATCYPQGLEMPKLTHRKISLEKELSPGYGFYAVILQVVSSRLERSIATLGSILDSQLI